MSNVNNSEGKKCCGSICSKLGLKALTKQNLIGFYIPAQGVVSYTSLSINVMNPSLILRYFPRRDITNILLLNTIVGSGFYIYSRKHLTNLPQRDRIMYSMFGATTFTLGSVLTWALFRSVLPENIPLCTAIGIFSGLCFIKIGTKYAEHIDSLVAK